MRSQLFSSLLLVAPAALPAAAQHVVLQSGDDVPVTTSDGFSPGGAAYNADEDEIVLAINGPSVQAQLQRIDAVTGTPLGAPVLLGDGSLVAVAHNPEAKEYLAVWMSQAPGTNLQRVLAQRFDGSTAAPLQPAQQISATAPIAGQLLQPEVAYNPIAHEYLVAWSSNVDVVRCQRLDGVSGAEVGADDFPISNVAAGGYDKPALAVNPVAGQIWVAWAAPVTGGLSEENEVFVQRLDAATLSEVGIDDQRVSTTGIDGDGLGSSGPSIAYSTVADRVLVVMRSTETSPTGRTRATLLDGTTGAQLGSTFDVDDVFDWTGGARVAAVDGSGHFLATWTSGPNDSDLDVRARLVDGVTGTTDGPMSEISDFPEKPQLNAWCGVLALREGTTTGVIGWLQVESVSPVPPYSVTNAYVQPVRACVPLPAVATTLAGSPPNPIALSAGGSGGAYLGATWSPSIDHTSFAPTAVLDALAISASPLNAPTAFGTLLLDPTAAAVATTTPGQPFAIPVPPSCEGLGLALVAQGLSVDPSGALALTNALELVIGGL